MKTIKPFLDTTLFVRAFMLTIILITGGGNSAWADFETELFSTNFSEDDGWTTEDIITSSVTSNSKTIKGTTISFKGYSTQNVSVAAGEDTSSGSLTFTKAFLSVSEGSVTASNPNNYMSIPLTGVVGSITVKYTSSSSISLYYTYDDGNTGSVVARSSSASSKSGSFTISGLTSDKVTLYLGAYGYSITSLTITTYQKIDLSDHLFRHLYEKSESNVSAATLISNAKLPSYITMDITNNNYSNNNTSTVTTPHNFSLLLDDSRYYRLKATSYTGTIKIGALSHVKSIRFYGNGASADGYINIAATKILGDGSSLTAIDTAFINSTSTVAEYSTGDLTDDENYDVDTYYLYTITFKKKSSTSTSFNLWGIYIEKAPDSNTSTVTYNGNGATSGSVPVDNDSPYTNGSTVTVLGNTGSLTKTGYAFNGWNTANDGSGEDYDVDDTFEISENTVLYAKWLQLQPVITTQPTTKSICVKDAETTLTVEATPSAGTCSYQWYSCDDAEKTNPEEVSTGFGYATASFSPSTSTAGNYYYFCRVTDSNGDVDTDIALVRVSANAEKSTWDLSSITAADFMLNTGFWTLYSELDPSRYYNTQAYSSNEEITIQNNFETDMLNGIRFYRAGSAVSSGILTIYAGRGINLQGTSSSHIKIPATTNHYYRITYARGRENGTYGYTISSGATKISGNLTSAFTDNSQRPSFIVKATNATINLYHTDNNSTLSKVEEVEAFAGEWSTTSDYVYQDEDSPDIPTFAVTASNGTTITKGTHYSVSYSLKYGSTAGIVTVDSSTGITDISTSTTGTATVIATITDLDTSDDFILHTSTFQYTITVSVPTSPTISITALPYTTVNQNSALTLKADVSGNPAPTIQWYSNTTASTSGGTPIDGETSETYSPSTSAIGNYYYYAIATNRAGDTTSDVVTLKVRVFDTSFSANAKQGNLAVSKNTNENPYTEITSTNVTISGGTIYAHNGQESSQSMITNNVTGFYMLYQNTYFKVTLSNAIKEGDIISYTINSIAAGRGVYISTEEVTSGETGSLTNYFFHGTSASGTETLAHGVTSDETWLIGATTLYIYRNGNVYFDDITISDPRYSSDLAAVSGKSALCLSSSTYTLTEDADFTTSSDGTITYESDNEDVATVDEDGEITYVGLGTATITVSQAVTDDYKAGSIEFTVCGTGAFTKGTTTLDFSNASATKTMLTGTWTGDTPYYGNDGTDNYMVFSPYSAYKSAASQTWVNDASGSDQADNASIWTYSDEVFGGIKVYKSNYRGTTNKNVWYGAMNAQTSPTDRRTATRYAYRVKGISKAEAVVRGGQSIIMAAHPVSESTASNVTHLFDKASTSGFNKLSIDLNEDTEYVIAFSTTSTDNERLYEVAFFYDSETDLGIEETINTAKSMTTFVTRSSMDFTDVNGVKAYVATSNDNSSVTLTRVKDKIPGGTPLILWVAATGTNYSIPVGCYATAPAVNNLVAADGVTDLGGDGVYDYVIYEGQFRHIGPAGPVAIGKCYLHFDGDPTATAARTMSILFVDDDTTTFIDNKNLGENQKLNAVYNLNGQKVSDKGTSILSKGLYIVDGKKIVIK